MIWCAKIACLFLMVFFLDACACFSGGRDIQDCTVSISIPYDWA